MNQKESDSSSEKAVGEVMTQGLCKMNIIMESPIQYITVFHMGNGVGVEATYLLPYYARVTASFR